MPQPAPTPADVIDNLLAETFAVPFEEVDAEVVIIAGSWRSGEIAFAVMSSGLPSRLCQPSAGRDTGC